MKPMHKKQQELLEYLAGLGSVAVAFSGGVDSTFLLACAAGALGDRVLAVTARSLSFPGRELSEAARYARRLGVEHTVVDTEEILIEGFAQNPVNRCYLCKQELFTRMKEAAAARGYAHMAEGSNTDDEGDYRPGLLAVAELGVLSPLRRARLGKEEIRLLSREMDLPTWDKPSFACLSSRIPYGEAITPERLGQIDQAEQLLLDMGFRQIRVRCHGNLARIETDAGGFRLLGDEAVRKRIHDRIRDLGFTYVAFDALGYRTGSMNETLELP